MLVDYTIGAIAYLFVAFVFVVKLKHKAAGTNWEQVTQLVFVFPFVIFDWLVNLVSCTVIFLDPPEHLFELVTGRMKRYKREYAYTTRLTVIEWWRYTFATVACKLVNQHDKEHC